MTGSLQALENSIAGVSRDAVRRNVQTLESMLASARDLRDKQLRKLGSGSSYVRAGMH